MRKKVKKLISMFLTAVMLAQMTPTIPVGFAVSAEHGTLGSAKLDAYHFVSLNNGTYYLDLELNAEFYEHRSSSNDTVPERGYFTANYDGWYLVELWGGNGADGIQDGAYLPGKGGKGGYVYGKVYLKEGQTLYYSLGGNGSVTYISGQGGGANGGGGGGSAITHGVGGGGGYSALFLFEKGEFESIYLDKNHNLIGDNISEYHRATRYLMIAGGGGGGGGARGATLSSGTNVRTADGGNGGGMTSLSGTIEAVGATVAGTYYAGGDGKSSGTSDTYIGHGGTNVPGAVAQTAWSWAEGEKPNDWTGAHNSAVPGGSGGAGNLRGGSGGGGFCGGSGGVQQSYISPTQVGGGGGGSSFIASSVNDKAVVTALTEAELKLLDGSDTENLPTSGAASITYLTGETDFSNLEDLTVTFSISDYFNLADLQMTPIKQIGTAGNGDPIYNIAYNPATGAITLSDISLVPSEDNLQGNLILRLGFTPKESFAGGNGVPLLKNNLVTCTEGDGGSSRSCTFNLVADNCCVNVPLNFEVLAHSHITNTPTKYTAVDMYTDQYTAVRTLLNDGDASNDGMYAFIQSIGTYTVDGITNTEVEISKTTEFPVSFTVIPKATDVASDAGVLVAETTFTKNAVVTVLGLHQGHLNGQLMEISKQLSYQQDGNKYLYSITVTANTSHEAQLPSPIEVPNGTDGDTIEIPHDGTYLVQVWGGDGHAGQTLGNYKGGNGGKGGYSYVYLDLEAEDVLTLTQVGKLGAVPDNGNSLGGGGGTYTAISFDNEILAVAGGGGGGGNGYVGLLSGLLGGKAGENGSSSSGNVSLPNSSGQYAAAFNGKAGGSGSLGWFQYIAGSGGDGGGNYRTTAAGRYSSTTGVGTSLETDGVVDAVALGVLTTSLEESTNPNTNGNGAVRITCLKLKEHAHVTEDLTNYGLDVQFSKYFDVSGTVSFVNNDATETALTANTNITSGNLAQISAINPAITTVDDAKTIDFTVTFTLTPKSGFLGGSDVPVLAYETAGIGTGARLSQTLTTDGEPETGYLDISRYIAGAGGSELDSANFANVKIPDTLQPIAESLQVYDKHLEEDAGVSVPRRGTAEDHDLGLYYWDPQWQESSGSEAWKSDFVHKIDILALKAHDDTTQYPAFNIGKSPAEDIGEAALLPEVNTHYTVTVGVGSEPAKIATAGPAVVNQTVTKTVNIFVRPRILFELSEGLSTDLDLGPDNCASMDPSADYCVTLVPDKGYAMPAAGDITLRYNDDDTAVPFGYNEETGQITILAADITKSMTLTAANTKQVYKIHYAYQVPDANSDTGYTETYFSQNYEFGASVKDSPERFDKTYNAPEIIGYDFQWRWYTDKDTHNVAADGDVPETMPADTLWVVGTYIPKTYTLVIEYVLADGITDDNFTAPDTYQQAFVFGDSYRIASPAVEGYASDLLYVTGTIDAALVENVVDMNGTLYIYKEVSYSPTTGRLRINYIYEDTGAVDVSIIENCPVGETYSVVTPSVTGYTPDVTVVTGEMDADGVVVNVTYSPNRYTLSFDTGTGGTPLDSRTVIYNSMYGYHIDGNGDKVFDSLPTQVLRPGYNFVGWYLNGEQVFSDTAVKTTENHTLTAKWQAKTYSFTLEYVYADGSTAFPSYTTELSYGAEYSFTATSLTGYDIYVIGAGGTEILGNTVSGTMPTQPVVRQFVYRGQPCNLTINYQFAPGVTGNDLPTLPKTAYQETVPYMSSYYVESPNSDKYPELDGFTPSPEIVSGTMDSLGGKTITVYYYQDIPVVSVTVTWGDLEFYCYRGNWNPDTHQYDKVTELSPSAPGTNFVTVTNNAESEMDVRSEFSYTPRNGYQHISGFFTFENSQAGQKISSAGVPVNTSKTAYLWLTGSMSNSVSGTITSGDCTVTITGGSE